MNKIKFIVLLLIACTNTVFAQFNVGIKAGLNYATIKAKNAQFEESGVLGYQAGVWARIGKSIYVQPEAYIGSKNTDIKFTQSGSTIEQKGSLKFTTLDIPVLLGKKFGVDKLNFHVVAGPSFQFNLDENNSAFSQATNPDFYKYRDFVTNLQIGGGVDLGNLSVDLRYETSLQDINTTGGQHNNLVHLGIGYKLF